MAPKTLLHEKTTRIVVDTFIQVHYELGWGFLESVYAASMACALVQAGLFVEREVPIAVHFRGTRVGNFRADLIVASTVLVEIKCSERLDPLWEAQVLNYLRATEVEVGLLLQFGHRPKVKRLIYTNDRKCMPQFHSEHRDATHQDATA